MSAKLKRGIAPILLILITLVIYIVTKNSVTSGFKLQMALVSILVLVGFIVAYRKKENEQTNAGLFTILISITVLLIVAATGWFYSPFFFTLYLLAILFAFIFGIGTSVAFIATLTILFSFNVGEVDIAYDFLVVLSLLTTVPLTIYLRKEYLKLRESQKQILILQKEQKEYKGLVEEVLSNKMVEFGVNIRQPINDTKQLAYQIEEMKGKHDCEKNTKRIIQSSDEALDILKQFEEMVTGKKLVSHLSVDRTKTESKDIFSHALPVSQASNPTLSKKP